LRPETVSALVVTWNSLGYIEECLTSLRGQGPIIKEIVVVDNGSADGTVEWLRRQADVTLIEEDVNLGFAAANNRGLARCSGGAVLLVNADVKLAPDYVDRCLGHMSREDIGSVTGKLLRAEPAGVIDSTGHNVYGLGWAENRGEMAPDGPSFDRGQEVFGVCAAAGLYRASALASVTIDGEIFDESYFSYIEDVDLDWRLRWAGWRAWYEPEAVAIHHRSVTGARFSAPLMRHILKNRLLTVVKNYDRRWLLRQGFGVAAFTTVKTADFGRRHPLAAMGLVDFARLLPAAMRKRRAVKSLRRASSAEMRGWLLPFPWRERVMRRVRHPGQA
jgi:GT2 family glycosyltransferase